MALASAFVAHHDAPLIDEPAQGGGASQLKSPASTPGWDERYPFERLANRNAPVNEFGSTTVPPARWGSRTGQTTRCDGQYTISIPSGPFENTRL
jgi:hypothetical protein